VPDRIYVDYADLRIMPTSPRSPCSARVGGLRMSA